MRLHPAFIQQLILDKKMAHVDGIPCRREGGQTITLLPPSASAKASVTGPILPSGVLLNIEQCRNRNRSQP
ncbi:MAG: hypothetical protein AAGG57_07055 [Pseudomonadota bacterium]